MTVPVPERLRSLAQTPARAPMGRGRGQFPSLAVQHLRDAEEVAALRAALAEAIALLDAANAQLRDIPVASSRWPSP